MIVLFESDRDFDMAWNEVKTIFPIIKKLVDSYKKELYKMSDVEISFPSTWGDGNIINYSWNKFNDSPILQKFHEDLWNTIKDSLMKKGWKFKKSRYSTYITYIEKRFGSSIIVIPNWGGDNDGNVYGISFKNESSL
jgi:hypothetical protein